MAYAAVISLKHTINRLQNLIDPKITKSANEELNSLYPMLKRLDDRSSRSIDRSVINELDAKIRDAVWKLEDVLESYVLYELLDHKGVEQEMSSFLKTVKPLREEYNRVLLQKPLPAEEEEEEEEDEALPAAVPPIHKSTTVGLSDLSQEIRKELLGWQSELKIVPVVGMAGIGKTHLATQIYHHQLIVQHFESRLWVSVGPKDQINNIIVNLVAHVEGKPRDLLKEKSERTLKELLLKSLHGRRYLIVVDDIWTTQSLDYLTKMLPDYGNRSRLLLTTRQQEVAEYYRKTKFQFYRKLKIHQVPFLNLEESWNLLWQNVFVGENTFPYQLEKPGRKIAEKCEGLPLLILAVADILRGLDKTEEYWMLVAEKKTTTFTDAYDQIYEVLLSSYEYLRQHLKACFLYMGVFPQSYEISFSKLIYFWSVEDILEPSIFQTLEDFGMDCVEGLVSESLVIVCKRRFEGFKKIKSSKLHSAYWHLCVTEARKSKFFHVLNKLNDVSIERPRRFAVQNNIILSINEVYDSMAAATSTHSVLCTGEEHQYPVRICFDLMLLKVFDALAIRFYEFPNEVLKLLQLMYLSLTHNGDLPCSISNLQQLQCLILRRHHDIQFPKSPTTYLPDEIWDMKELRHLRLMGSHLPDPTKGAQLPKLSTLYVSIRSCSADVYKSIPNLKKLGIRNELEPDQAVETSRFLDYVWLFEKLESLKCVAVNPRLQSQLEVSPSYDLLYLPRGLRKLSLKGLGYSWKDMSEIGSLRFFEVLKLRCAAFQGAEWEITLENLQYLLLEDIDLVHWTAPKGLRSLRHLIVRHCYKLKKIPEELGDCKYLKMIEVEDCSPSVVASALQIKKKSKSSDLQVVINSSWS